MASIVNSTLTLLPALVGIGLVVGCRAAEPSSPGPVPGESLAETPVGIAPDVGDAVSPFGYLQQRYDADGDGVITAAEYTRHDGQLARWDRDGDGRLTQADWADATPDINPQIMTMRRMDVLGRYFQTDENGHDTLTIDELANAFFDYDEAGMADEELTEAEFLSMKDERAIEMPGDGSMMAQSYVGNVDGWERLTEFYDMDGSQTLSMAELATVFDGSDSYELHFDQVRFDDGTPGAHFEKLAYRAGLVVGSDIPEVTLTALHGAPSIDLAGIAGGKPVALIFGSYT
ncbi:MAG: hypothetical protein ACI8QZ_003282 [Chlamydiales bacterium]|jgi:hypothetical protein